MVRAFCLSAVALFLSATPAWSADSLSDYLFFSDGSSVAVFSCHGSTQEYAPPFITYNDGRPAPSIEYRTTSGVSVNFAHYAFPGLPDGYQLHGILDVRLKSANGVPLLAAFGESAQSGCSRNGRPVPLVAYYDHGGENSWIEIQTINDQGNPEDIIVPYSLDDQWHRVDVTISPDPAGGYRFVLWLDYQVLAEVKHYRNLVNPEVLSIAVGDGSSNIATNVLYDNVFLELTLSDSDLDGIPDTDDSCPQVPNSDQIDTDGDGLGDSCDPDDDDDSVLDQDDNCPFDSNPDQSDLDLDTVGDVCDQDSDGDGVSDQLDQCPRSPLDSIVDGDGCSIHEVCPCDSAWRNHGAYVRCIAHTSSMFLDLELISALVKDEIVASAAQMPCGAKD